MGISLLESRERGSGKRGKPLITKIQLIVKAYEMMLMYVSPSDELDQFETECEDLFHHFQHRNLDALVSAVRTTLDALRRRITTRCIHFTGSESIIHNLMYNIMSTCKLTHYWINYFSRGHFSLCIH